MIDASKVHYPHPRQSLVAMAPRWLWVVAGFVGLFTAVLSLLMVALPFVLPRFFVSSGVVAVGYGLILLAMSISLILVSIRGWHREDSRRVGGRWVWVVFLGLTVAAGAAGVLMPPNLQGSAIFGPFHTALIVFPALFLFALVIVAAGRSATLTFRQMTLMMMGGASSILLALPVELLGFLLSGAIVVMVAILFPAGEREVSYLLDLVQRWSVTPPTGVDQMVGVLGSPVVVATMGLTLSVVTPLIEEFAKALIVGVVGVWVKPKPLGAFIWGAACGLGFAMLEGVSNGAMGLGGVVAWLGGGGVRFVATAMHILTSGVVGLGWGWAWRRRWWALPLCYVASVVFHGLWNFNVVLALGGIGAASSHAGWGGVLVVVAVVLQIGLVLATFMALGLIPLALRDDPDSEA
jgi:hypothetical protein